MTYPSQLRWTSRLRKTGNVTLPPNPGSSHPEAAECCEALAEHLSTRCPTTPTGSRLSWPPASGTATDYFVFARRLVAPTPGPWSLYATTVNRYFLCRFNRLTMHDLPVVLQPRLPGEALTV